ncbi:hypothetical protein B9Z55_007142 [Caenorhabditis nigoni]|uniref:Uncharacterized protein n=1 Tax=Caenorhabditis nigoni TaxID=1611254 RepID=A0A2G5V900_9PELO|nr:hypothetical protein B9Z55_007142 [Caenorhabditis nigoni]
MDTTLSESEKEEQWEKSKKVKTDKKKVKGDKENKEKKGEELVKTRFLKMKPLEWKKFDGSENSQYDDWKTILMEGFGKDPRMTKLNKLIHLKGLVTGLAEDLLEGVKLVERNYEVAWAILNKHFEKPARPLLTLERKFNRIKIDKKTFKKNERRYQQVELYHH